LLQGDHRNLLPLLKGQSKEPLWNKYLTVPKPPHKSVLPEKHKFLMVHLFSTLSRKRTDEERNCRRKQKVKDRVGGEKFT